MTDTTPNRTVRELDCRINDGFEVRLLWNSLTDFVSVSVDDTRYGESFEFEVAPAAALDAFRHPLAYTRNNHGPQSQLAAHVPARWLPGKDER